jgi:hypothetical protein
LADESGDTTVFVAFALTVFIFYSCVHIALVMHGRSVVAAAAQDALAAAQLEDGTDGDGAAAAYRTLEIAPGLRNVSVSVATNGADTEVRVQVSAEVETVLVDMFNRVEADVVGPKERFYTELERP